MAAENVKFLNINNDAIFTEDVNQVSSSDIPTIDIRNGGQWGLLPRIGGVDNGAAIQEWMHEQAYQKRDLIPVVLTLPRMFDLFPDPKVWKEAVKAMIEVHSKTIEGLDSSLTVSTNEHDLGLSGAKFKEIGKVERASSDVTIGLTEKSGNPFEILLDVWIRYGLSDPDVAFPLITRIAPEANLPKAWTADWYTMSVLFIEPDILHRKPIHSWLVSNMFPTSNPDVTGKKDKSAGREVKEMSINLGGFALPGTNKRVHQLATTVLNNLELFNKDSEDILLPVDSVDASIATSQDVDIFYDGVKSANETSNANGNSTSATDGANSN